MDQYPSLVSWPRVPPPDEQRQPSKRRLPKSSIRILQNWFSAHSYHPYASDTERGSLELQTGLSTSQVANWLSNARRRQRHARGSKVIPSVATRSVPDLHAAHEWGQSDPLTRWRNSPPEEEHVSLKTLARAINETSNIDAANRHAGQHTEPHVQASQAASDTSFESWDSLHSSGSSSSRASTGPISTGSAGAAPFTQYRITLGRRRRQDHLRTRTTSLNHPSLGARMQDKTDRIYQCTFCTDTFRTKFDWVRHEGSLHLALEKWICLYRGPTYHSTTKVVRCVFCDEPNPTEDHLTSHRCHECMDKQLQGRTFFRRDHLRQHMRLVHGSDRVYPSMQEWQLKATRINCRCGFCGQRFQNWDERSEHLADHFRAGAQMKDWTGCRGLDPAVALHVQNAIPPYLIGTETNDFEPFSASTNCNASQADRRQSRQPTRFEDLTNQLAEYVRSAIAEGITVTDETVRRKARLYMFGDDDAWNQTPADNGEWLRLFKLGLNLGTYSQNVGDPIALNMDEPTDDNGHASVSVTGTVQSPSVSVPGITDLTIIDDFFTVPEVSSLSDVPTSSACNAATADIPLAWQTPECLAEFEEMRLARKDRGGHGSDQACVPEWGAITTSSIAAEVSASSRPGVDGGLADVLGRDSLGLDMDFFFEEFAGP